MRKIKLTYRPNPVYGLRRLNKMVLYQEEREGYLFQFFVKYPPPSRVFMVAWKQGESKPYDHYDYEFAAVYDGDENSFTIYDEKKSRNIEELGKVMLLEFLQKPEFWVLQRTILRR